MTKFFKVSNIFQFSDYDNEIQNSQIKKKKNTPVRQFKGNNLKYFEIKGREKHLKYIYPLFI